MVAGQVEMVAGQVETVAKQVELVAGNRAVPEAPSRSAGRGLEKSLSMLARPSGRGPTSPNSILPTTRPKGSGRKERIGKRLSSGRDDHDIAARIDPIQDGSGP
jgi:hypothetical protein